jgi:mevalonate kinase
MIRTSLSGREFTGKILLFGEHSVIDGSKALVVPFERFKGRLIFERSAFEEVIARLSNLQLGRLAEYLKNRDFPIDHDDLMTDLEEGLWFRSTIPERYGLGSSGALCASVYHEYRLFPERSENENLRQLQATLASMESFYHGRSSGIDPLCIYLQTPILAKGTRNPAIWQPQEKKQPFLHVFLLDTENTGNTGDQVKLLRDRLASPGFFKNYQETYIPMVNQIVDDCLKGRLTLNSLHRLSEQQQIFFREVIPEKYLSIWKQGIENGRYALKLCGSGGGGYLVGFTPDMSFVRQDLGRYALVEFAHLQI